MIRIEFKGGQGHGKSTFRKYIEQCFKRDGIEYTNTDADRLNEDDALMLPTTENILKHVRDITIK